MRVKICGVTRAADALAAAEAGASAIGFVFWPGSPRWIDARAAREIVRALPPFVTPVGVFVDQPVEEMERIAGVAGVRALQLHGRESADTCRRLSVPVIKAVALDGDGAAHGGDAAAPDVLSDLSLDLPPDVTLLLDAHDPVRFGGTGVTIDWERAAKIARERRVILSGGLTPANVAAAIRAVRPYGVDVSSGVEAAPGVKDAGLVRAFVHSAHAAGFGPAFGRRDPAPGGWFGPFGGRFVPETLVTPLEELESAYLEARLDASFGERLAALLSGFAGRPTPLHAVERLGVANGGARLFLKREDLAHTGAHKINNAIGQALLAQRMGKRRIVAETGAGQHGVATATACALLGLACVVYMGAEDMERQAPNVHRMRLLGAEIRRVDAGSRTLKDAINEAMREWVASVRDTHYLLGSVLGPHPYPLMVREFQSVIGEEAKEQMRERTGGPPSAVVACIGGGSNAIGIFDAFVADPGVRLIGVEAGGEGIVAGRHAARFPAGHVGVLHGTRSYLLQDDDGNVEPTWSVAAGLDYPAIGPEHAWLREQGRAEYAWVSDEAALAAFHALARHEGILPALESAHAVAYALELARELDPSATVLVNLSGRGDKDLASVVPPPDRDPAPS